MGSTSSGSKVSGSLLRIATRGSKLALWQAEHVRDRLLQQHPGLRVELVVLKTKGDLILDRPLAEAGGKGLFVKELESALLENQAAPPPPADVIVEKTEEFPALPPGPQLVAPPAPTVIEIGRAHV